VLFVVAALFIAAGGPQHPGGSMAEMLANPKWMPAHLLLLAGFVSLLAGLVLFGRSASFSDRTRRWLRLALFGTVLQAIEMAFHAAAMVDHDNLVAGRATPILSTHLAMAVIFYPAFAVTLIGFIIAGARDRAVGSPWISCLGIVGLAGHGAAAPLVVLFKVPGAARLFPFLMGFALWMLLAGLIGSRRTASGRP
jgi:hypothetical protein